MRRIGFGALCALACFAGASLWNFAWAQGACTVHQDQEQRRVEARARFQQGQQLFEANQFQEAMAHFECSFQNVPHPSTLYNVARSAELTGQFSRALDAWRGYLQMSPDAEDRAEIEERIRGLEQASAASATQQTTVDPSMSGQGQTQGTWTQPLPQNTSSAAAPAQWETPEDVPTNVYTPGQEGQTVQVVERREPSPWRRYAWYILGGGAVLTLVGILLATPVLNLASDDEYTTENDGACYDAEADAEGRYYISKGCWISGAVLAGAGVAAMAASIFIWAFAERGGEYVVTRTAGFSPTLALGASGEVSGLGGSFTLRF